MGCMKTTRNEMVTARVTKDIREGDVVLARGTVVRGYWQVSVTGTRTLRVPRKSRPLGAIWIADNFVEEVGGESSTFKPGAKVLLDKKTEATVIDCFPEGSTSFLFPHYRVRVGAGYGAACRVWGPNASTSHGEVLAVHINRVSA